MSENEGIDWTAFVAELCGSPPIASKSVPELYEMVDEVEELQGVDVELVAELREVIRDEITRRAFSGSRVPKS